MKWQKMASVSTRHVLKSCRSRRRLWVVSGRMDMKSKRQSESLANRSGDRRIISASLTRENCPCPRRFHGARRQSQSSRRVPEKSPAFPRRPRVFPGNPRTFPRIPSAFPRCPGLFPRCAAYSPEIPSFPPSCQPFPGNPRVFPGIPVLFPRNPQGSRRFPRRFT